MVGANIKDIKVKKIVFLGKNTSFSSKFYRLETMLGLVSFLTGNEFHRYPISVTILLVISIKKKMMILILFLSKFVAAKTSLFDFFQVARIAASAMIARSRLVRKWLLTLTTMTPFMVIYINIDLGNQ